MQIQAFPIYVTRQEQFRFNPKLEGYAAYHLYAPHNAFLPFLLYKASDRALIDCVRVFNEEDEEVLLLPAGSVPYQYFTSPTHDYLFYYGEPVANLNLPCGRYYLEFSIAHYKRYSEVFTVSTDLSRYLSVQWSSDKSVDYLTYQTGWKQQAYLLAELTEPEYAPTIDDSEDGYGVALLNFGKVAKTIFLKNSDYLPEFLVDALALLPLHAHVHIGPYQNVQQPKLKPEWQLNGALAQVEIEFAEAQVFMTGCENITLTAVDTTGYQPLGYYCGVDTTEAHWVDTGLTRCEEIDVPEPVYAWRVKESSAYCIKE